MSEHPRSWNWDDDGDVLEGHYVEVDEAPERFDYCPIVVLETATGERVGVWLFSTVLRSRFAEEARRRPSGDFEPGERICIERLSECVSASGRRYRDFRVAFEHAGDRRSPVAILGEPTPQPSTNGAGRPAYDPRTAEIPF